MFIHIAFFCFAPIALALAVEESNHGTYRQTLGDYISRIAQEPAHPHASRSETGQFRRHTTLGVRFLENVFRQQDRQIEGEEDSVEDLEDSKTPEPIQSVGPFSDGATGGFTLDLCLTDNDCLSPRICLGASLIGLEPCSGGLCRCVDLGAGSCDSDGDCVEGEGCFKLEDFPVQVPSELENAQFCASRATQQILGGDMPCIASQSLSHLPRTGLVYKKDVMARVLCDEHGSCATKGHIVKYKGKAMMMKSYCEVSSCVEKVMKVNSPRYRRGLTVDSRSEYMVFTCFAAKYETRTEEGFLSIAVRLGF